MVSVAVLVSGGGTNLQALIDSITAGNIRNGTIKLVVSDREGAYALTRAENAGINSAVVSRKEAKDITDFNAQLLRVLKAHDIELVVLGGFLSILNSQFVNAFQNRIINIHPALIPSFSGKGYYGLKVHKEALRYGVKITGATAHFVSEDIDGGPVILQKAVVVPENIRPEELQKKVMEEAEWVILPQAVDLFCNGKLKIEGRKVIIS